MFVKHSLEIPSQPLPTGVGASKAVLISDNEAPNFAMRKFTIQPGGSMPMHFNLGEHEQYVLSGKALVIINEIPHAVSAGDAVFIPAEVLHSYRVTGEEPFVFLCLVPNKPDETILVN
jgi:quercetin dioxygenase-like cupin family protein